MAYIRFKISSQNLSFLTHHQNTFWNDTKSNWSVIFSISNYYVINILKIELAGNEFITRLKWHTVYFISYQVLLTLDFNLSDSIHDIIIQYTFYSYIITLRDHHYFADIHSRVLAQYQLGALAVGYWHQIDALRSRRWERWYFGSSALRVQHWSFERAIQQHPCYS